MVIFFLFLNILCRRDGSRTCLVCCHFSFDVASIHEMPSISFHLNLETLKLLLSQSSCSQFFLLLSRERKFGSFHVVVLQIYAKKFAKISYPRAQPLFCLLNVFVSCRSRRRRCRCRGFLKLPIQKCALCFLLLVVSRTIRTQSVELFGTLAKKYVFHVKYVKRKVDLLRYIGIAR